MKNLIFIISGPSGVGKGTIVKSLVKNKSLKLVLSISSTSREIRKTEKNGVDYFYITKDEFKTKIKNGDFLEWNKHFENYYGTLKFEINKIHSKKKNPILEIEVNGALDVIKKTQNKYRIVSIFISPPSIKDLRMRLEKRGTESQKEIRQRIKRVKFEIKRSKYFKYNVENNQLKETINEISKIVMKEIKNEACN